MTFEWKPTRYDDGSGSDHWFSGRYKITKYDAIASGPYRRRTVYHAYFKPLEWTMWGNHVDRAITSDTGYPSLSAAKSACRRHAEKFPVPHAHDSL
jgi:hypothetical protein